ncbi:hypothetical protein AGLY_008021 [Aphis glycines]|uniref:DUF4371 domain-containing protein n=1 Tax=Aphis glycines TaxID=307491 RepID=A0A6G0TP86_APHGL|nr:hypothetical protein AGLY_008021 [Aphis glycines]
MDHQMVIKKRKKTSKESEKKFLANAFSGVLDILKSNPPKDFPNDVFTIKYIADVHKSSPTQISYFKRKKRIPTPDLSFPQYEKIISLTAKHVMHTIESEIMNNADIFSLSIDPLSNTDSSAIFIRYVNDTGFPVKHFLEIIDKRGDDTLQIMDILHTILDKYNLKRNGFMGLSYDCNNKLQRHNYTGLKSSLKAINEHATIWPCSDDSLSGIITYAATCVYECNQFHKTVHKLFDFLMIFRYQWDQVQFLFKNLPDIEFLSKNQLLQYLIENWSTIFNALFQISENISFPQKIRVQAFVILMNVKRLETCIVAMFWAEIAEEITNHQEQLLLKLTTEIDFQEIFEIYDSLINYFDGFRTNEKFMYYKTCAFEKTRILHFNHPNHTEQPQMRFPVDYMDDAERFKINTYFLMIDQIQSELYDRKLIYKDLAQKFNFLNKIPEITDNELLHGHEYLQNIYIDLTFHISAECMELKNLFNNFLASNKNYHSNSITGIATYIRSTGFKEYFTELTKVIKMALCIPALHCPVQQSAAILDKIITALQPVSNQDSYKSLLLINLEARYFNIINFKDVINHFSDTYSTFKHIK